MALFIFMKINNVIGVSVQCPRGAHRQAPGRRATAHRAAPARSARERAAAGPGARWRSALSTDHCGVRGVMGDGGDDGEVQ